MTDFVKTSGNNHILELILNRQEKKNALTQDMYLSLAENIEKANNDDEVRVILIRAEGESFCAGNDLNDFVKDTNLDDAAPVVRFLLALANNNKPLVAAIQGSAVGIGTTLLLHCDLVYARDDTRFCLPFVHLGACVEGGGSRLLPALCGYQKAAELLLLGERFDVQEAKSFGLVTRIIEQQSAENAAREACEKISRLPPDAVQTTRRLMKEHDRPAVLSTIQRELTEFQRLLQTEDSKQRLAAVLKR